MDKSDNAYKTIGEVAKILNLKTNKKGDLPTHIIRFWETQFKQIKPKILNSNRRYYDEKSINLLKKVKVSHEDSLSLVLITFVMRSTNITNIWIRLSVQE